MYPHKIYSSRSVVLFGRLWLTNEEAVWSSQVHTGYQANSRQANIFMFSLDSDSDNIGEVSSEDEWNGSPGNEANTWTQSSPQATERSIN